MVGGSGRDQENHDFSFLVVFKRFGIKDRDIHFRGARRDSGGI